MNTPTSRRLRQAKTLLMKAGLPQGHLRVAAYLSLAVLLVSACGKRRPPLPPVERVQQRTELLSGVQRGNQVILSWPAAQRNAPDSSVQSIRRIDVYRLAERPGAPLPLTEEEFGARSTVVGSVTYDQIKMARDELNYTDTLELAGEPTRLRYAIRYVNAAGQRAAFSNFLLIEPAARIARPPTLLKSDIAENGITITWQAPQTNIDGSMPVNLLGYNVYRMDESQTEVSPTALNSAPVSGTQYTDKNFEFGKNYRYITRSVSLGTEGAQVESLNSNALTVSPKDIFPPAPPATPSVNAAPGRISIFFATNTEPDVVGYDIYRSTDENLPKDRWTKLNAAPLTRTAYQDENVESGKRYFYYIKAIDKAGNVSPPSDVSSDIVP